MNHRVKMFIIWVIVLIVIILIPIIINVKKVNISVEREVKIIDSWIESEIKIKWSKDWKILDKKEVKNYFIRVKDQKGNILLLDCKASDFYFYVKKGNFIYVDYKVMGFFDYLILKNKIFMIFYIFLGLLYFILTVFLYVQVLL